MAAVNPVVVSVHRSLLDEKTPRLPARVRPRQTHVHAVLAALQARLEARKNEKSKT
jgi:hypothetical protein